MPSYQDYILDFDEINQLEILLNKWNSKNLEDYTREQKMLAKKNLTTIFSKLV